MNRAGDQLEGRLPYPSHGHEPWGNQGKRRAGGGGAVGPPSLSIRRPGIGPRGYGRKPIPPRISNRDLPLLSVLWLDIVEQPEIVLPAEPNPR